METWNIWAVHSREWWDMGVILSCVNEAVWHVEDVKSSVLSKLIISRNEMKLNLLMMHKRSGDITLIQECLLYAYS